MKTYFLLKFAISNAIIHIKHTLSIHQVEPPLQILIRETCIYIYE